MEETTKFECLKRLIDARNAAALEKLKAENAHLRARAAADEYRVVLSRLPKIFLPHLGARYNFHLS